ncbi:MAG: DUF3179 domain-containing (seleno)protein [Saprospiraceae bacterium]|nr:DUF3179 domain-containing (seleno)protein [Saprospiraceae bacterium]
MIKLNTILTFFALAFLVSCSQSENTVPEPPKVGSQSFKIIQENINGKDIVVVGSGQRNIVTAFEAGFGSVTLQFEPTSDFIPSVMKDQRGNTYNIFGQVIEGPDMGKSLKPVNAGMGFWFAFASRYPGMELHGEGTLDVNVNTDPDNDWLVPTQYVAQGAGFDAIQSLQSAKFEEYNVSQLDPDDKFYLNENDLVIAVNIDGEERVYPISILNWHEVINDEIAGVPISVTHCPLTGTSKVWRRPEFLDETTFGVSGFLYNSNLLAFDRVTESFWTQIEALCVFGDLKSEQLEVIPHVETTLATWTTFDISPLIMSDDTGIIRDYTKYPYGDYRTNHASISYPLAYDDDRLKRKERVFCVEVGGTAKAYRLSDF